MEFSCGCFFRRYTFLILGKAHVTQKLIFNLIYFENVIKQFFFNYP